MGIDWPSDPSLALDLGNATDDRLLELIKHGTRSQRTRALRAIYTRYYLDVWRFIISKCTNEQDAKDVFCEVWAVALSKLPGFVWQGKPIRVWLVTVAQRKLLELFRKTTEAPIVLDEEILAQALRFVDSALQIDEPASPETPCAAVRARADLLLQKAVSILDPKERQIIYLIYYKEENSTEIGQKLGMKPGTVRQKHRRALIKLRRSLSDATGSEVDALAASLEGLFHQDSGEDRMRNE